MKIVQINAVYEFSSTGRTTMEMHQRLIKDGYQSFVFCADKNIPDLNVHRIGSRIDHMIHALFSRLFGKQGYFSICATKRLVRRLDDIKPDVVILRNLHSNFVNFPIILNYLADNNVATIGVLHDCWFFTGHCYYYTQAACERWRDGCGSCPNIKDACPSIFWDKSRECYSDKKKLFGRIDKLAVVGVSDWVTSEARQSNMFSSHTRILRIYNWINLRVFYPRNGDRIRGKLSLSENDFVILSVSQGWSERKGLFKIFDVAKVMPEVKFVLVGTFSFQGPVPENVIVAGVTSNVDELAEYYSMADALLVCSVQETFGKVSAEALSCGTPVIANDATANPEIAGEECGISVHNNNIDEIVAAIQKIRKLSKHHYSAKCIERAKCEFDFETQIKKYYDLFSELTDWKNA